MNITSIIIMAVCLLMSAYFSATETAFSTLSKTKLKALAEKGNKRATRTLAIAEKYDRLISTILIGNNVVNILLSSLATVTVISLCLQFKDQRFADNYGSAIATAAATIVVLIFGEITPKSIAADFPEKFAMFSTPLMRVLMVILTPISALFSLWKKLIAKIFRLKPDNKISQEELLMLVEEVEEDGTIDEEEGDLLRNAITFTELKAEDILTHRVDLEAFSKDTPMEEIAEMFLESQFSRLLVYEDSIDNIIGVVHQKDLFTVHGITERPLEELITPPIFIHKTERIDDLLRDLQTSKSHMAIVLDEYGGTLGIVTMEDILEELVGDIWDEHDVSWRTIRRSPPTPSAWIAVNRWTNSVSSLTWRSSPTASPSTVGSWRRWIRSPPAATASALRIWISPSPRPTSTACPPSRSCATSAPPRTRIKRSPRIKIRPAFDPRPTVGCPSPESIQRGRMLPCRAMRLPHRPDVHTV